MCHRIPKEIKDKDKILKLNGYHLSRINGSHYIYTKIGVNHVSINKDIHPPVWLRLVKENNLVEVK